MVHWTTHFVEVLQQPLIGPQVQRVNLRRKKFLYTETAHQKVPPILPVLPLREKRAPFPPIRHAEIYGGKFPFTASKCLEQSSLSTVKLVFDLSIRYST